MNFGRKFEFLFRISTENLNSELSEIRQEISISERNSKVSVGNLYIWRNSEFYKKLNFDFQTEFWILGRKFGFLNGIGHSFGGKFIFVPEFWIFTTMFRFLNGIFKFCLEIWISEQNSKASTEFGILLLVFLNKMADVFRKQDFSLEFWTQTKILHFDQNSVISTANSRVWTNLRSNFSIKSNFAFAKIFPLSKAQI